jgi:hypothetical protein
MAACRGGEGDFMIRYRFGDLCAVQEADLFAFQKQFVLVGLAA